MVTIVDACVTQQCVKSKLGIFLQCWMELLPLANTKNTLSTQYYIIAWLENFGYVNFFFILNIKFKNLKFTALC